MACTMHLTVENFRFAFHFGLGEGDGVVIEPGTHDLQAPNFLNALAEALRIYPTLDAVVCLEHYAYCYARPDTTDAQLKNYFYNADDDDLAETVHWYEVAMNQNYLDVTPAMVRYAEAAIWEQQRQLNKQAKETKKAEKRASAAYKGFVYLIQSPTGAYKIGRTTNPNDRMKTFSVKLPFEVDYVCVIQTDDMYGLESQLHNKFAKNRVNGEWFALTPDEVEYIKGLAK